MYVHVCTATFEVFRESPEYMIGHSQDSPVHIIRKHKRRLRGIVLVDVT